MFMMVEATMKMKQMKDYSITFIIYFRTRLVKCCYSFVIIIITMLSSIAITARSINQLNDYLLLHKAIAIAEVYHTLAVIILILDSIMQVA